MSDETQLAAALVNLNALLTRLAAEQHVLIESLIEQRLLHRELFERRVQERLHEIENRLRGGAK